MKVFKQLAWWVAAFGGLVVLILTPMIGFDRPIWLLLLLPLLLAWAVWLTAEYMRWVKTLGR